MPKLMTFCLLVCGLALASGPAFALKSYTIPASTVHKACGGHQTGTANGQFGCSRCDGGVCRDYNCSDGSHGVKKGCREVIIDRKTPPRTTKLPGHGTGVNKVGTTTNAGATKIVHHPIDVGVSNKAGSVSSSPSSKGGKSH